MNRRDLFIFCCLAIMPLLVAPLGGCSGSWDPLSPLAKVWENEAGAAAADEERAEEQVESPSGQVEPGTDQESDPSPENVGDEGGEVGPSSHSPGDEVPSDLNGVEWLHADVSGWSETGRLSSVRVSGSSITLDYDKARSWRGVDHAGAFVNANPWIFVYRNGKWYAGTWEWLRSGQTTKSVRSVAGDHIKKPPLQSFKPKSGEVYGFMVSGLARDDRRNVRERTQVLMYRWP